ncbi:MAG: hypothetical protein M1816_002372 [Peltula sp. TS41687]|nr:MAG: hypothetical protein M1816_002372 [Peltula sp. TS41687]
MASKMLELRDQTGSLSTERNAGVIIRSIRDQYLVEMFEISPTNKAVIEAKGRLRRCFPGPAVVVSGDRIADSSFRQPLAELLTQLDADTPKEAQPIATKAGSHVVEIRDTVHPGLVTEMLSGILRANGSPLEVPRVHMRICNDVL